MKIIYPVFNTTKYQVSGGTTKKYVINSEKSQVLTIDKEVYIFTYQKIKKKNIKNKM